MKKIDAVFLAGPQGSGKGTQGRLLAEKLGFLFWDTGAVLREMSKEKDELAKKLAAMNKGELLPDEVIIEILKERLVLMPLARGVVFTAFRAGSSRRSSWWIFCITMAGRISRPFFWTYHAKRRSSGCSFGRKKSAGPMIPPRR